MSRRSSSQKKKKSSQSAFHKASAAPRSNSKKSSVNSYLWQLGENIRSVRARRGMTIHQLARASSLSARFLTTVELGRGNISVGRLNTVAGALEVPIEMLAADAQPTSPAFNQSTAFLKKLPPGQLRDAHKLLLEKFANVDASVRRSRIALIGLRGAGKSTLGSLFAQQLGVPFIELDKQVERDSGVTLTIIFDLYGPSGYRRMEREALESILAKHPRFVLATGGGIVSDPANFNRLLSECFTIWLRAKPEEHMARVLAQGDRRPMANNRQAMRDLRRILWSREALYRQADIVVETTSQTVRQSLQALALGVRLSP
jgi:XRE family aerobic/anaerobic benzoate catabolism transcriptional regulator